MILPSKTKGDAHVLEKSVTVISFQETSSLMDLQTGMHLCVHTLSHKAD